MPGAVRLDDDTLDLDGPGFFDESRDEGGGGVTGVGLEEVEAKELERLEETEQDEEQEQEQEVHVGSLIAYTRLQLFIRTKATSSLFFSTVVASRPTVGVLSLLHRGYCRCARQGFQGERDARETLQGCRAEGLNACCP